MKAKRKTSRPKAKNARRARPKTKNPFIAAPAAPKRRRRHSHRPRRKNPSPRRAVSTTGSVLIDGLTALIALVATRQLPQMLLKEKNSGFFGWGANALTAILMSFGAKKLVSPRAGNVALIGGAMYIVTRVMQEKLSPLGNYLSLTGLGDATAATSLGTLDDNAYFIHPTTYNDDGSVFVPNQIPQAVMRQLPPPPAAAPAAMAGLDRFAYGR